jgi:hypothetical protein
MWLSSRHRLIACDQFPLHAAQLELQASLRDQRHVPRLQILQCEAQLNLYYAQLNIFI